MNKSESKYYNTAVLMDEALLLLLETKDFDFITIKEICKKAGVNRSTFYLHYENTNDLLNEAIGLINKRFNESFNNKIFDAQISSKEDSFFITKEYLIPYLTFVKENKRVFKLIHDKPSVFNAQKVFTKMYNDFFTIILSKYGVKEEEKQYIFEFYTQGTLSIVMKWLSNDCVESIEDISTLIISLINHKSNR